MKKPVSILMTCLLAAGLAGCGNKEKHAQSGTLPVATVSTAKVEAREHTRAQWLPGTAHPADKAVIAAKLMATVRKADFTIGQKVTTGQTLVLLDAAEIDAQVEQARASLAQVERNYLRERALLEQKATTAETVRTLEDEMRMAKARLAEAETRQGYTDIRVPFDGTITSKEIRRGDLARPGMPLLTIEGTGYLQVHVQVPDSLSALPHGTMVRMEADGRLLDARLTEWSPAADPASRTRLAKLDLAADAPVRSGQYIRVNWPAGQTQSLWIPATALSPMGQMERVFTVDDGRIQLRLVRTGSREGDAIQVLSGLKAGEDVVLAPSAQLRDGQPATIQP
jgi:RND family efflux transporter MFP subunit